MTKTKQEVIKRPIEGTDKTNTKKTPKKTNKYGKTVGQIQKEYVKIFNIQLIN